MGERLRRLIELSHKSRHLLHKKKEEPLTTPDRVILAKLIVDVELSLRPDKSEGGFGAIRKDVWLKWAEEIVALWPEEDPKVYYVPYTFQDGRSHQAKGLLQFRYQTVRKSYVGERRGSQIRKRSKQSSSGTPPPSSPAAAKRHAVPPQEPEPPRDELDETPEDCVAWLRGSSSPPYLVEEKWRCSFSCRKALLENSSFIDYLEAFPAVLLGDGHRLVSIKRLSRTYNFFCHKLFIFCLKSARDSVV